MRYYNMDSDRAGGGAILGEGEVPQLRWSDRQREKQAGKR